MRTLSGDGKLNKSTEDIATKDLFKVKLRKKIKQSIISITFIQEYWLKWKEKVKELPVVRDLNPPIVTGISGSQKMLLPCLC